MTLPMTLLFPPWLFPSVFSHIVFSSPFPFLPFCFILLNDSLLYYITFYPSNNITSIFWNLTSHHLLTEYIQFQVTENPVQMGLSNREILLIHVIEKPRSWTGFGYGLTERFLMSSGLQSHFSAVLLALPSCVCGLNRCNSSQIGIFMLHELGQEFRPWFQPAQQK